MAEKYEVKDYASASPFKCTDGDTSLSVRYDDTWIQYPNLLYSDVQENDVSEDSSTLITEFTRYNIIMLTFYIAVFLQTYNHDKGI